MTGTVVTFYSYKGGVGRTLALANTAAILSQWGYRVLCVDWDLDAPGLGFYFQPRPHAADERGLVDLIHDFAKGRRPNPRDYTIPFSLPHREGKLDFIPAGSGGDSYVRQVQELDWPALYERGVGEFLEDCRARWKAMYDFVLIDSRTGITDIGGICTAQLPEILVMLFTANEQSLRGTLDVARRAMTAQDALPYDRAQLMILPVPTRFDAREEYKRAQSWQRRLAEELGPLVGNWAPVHVSMEKLLGHITIPYVSYWSFGEELPALTEYDVTPEKISYSMEALAATIAHRLDRTEQLTDNRDSFVASAARAGQRVRADEQWDVFISHAAHDKELARQLTAELSRRSLRVFLDEEQIAPGADWVSEINKAVSNSRSFVVLTGQPFDRTQTRDLERYLRQSIDESSGRPVIPVLTPGAHREDLPTILHQYQFLRMKDSDSDAINTLVHQLVRVISATGGQLAPSGALSRGARQEAFETLAEIPYWRLDPLRWQLVEQGVETVDMALERRDENTLRHATSDLELLSPVRMTQLGKYEDTEIPARLSGKLRKVLDRLDYEMRSTAGRGDPVER